MIAQDMINRHTVEERCVELLSLLSAVVEEKAANDRPGTNELSGGRRRDDTGGPCNLWTASPALYRRSSHFIANL